jgi:hypothetical protein
MTTKTIDDTCKTCGRPVFWEGFPADDVWLHHGDDASLDQDHDAEPAASALVPEGATPVRPPVSEPTFDDLAVEQERIDEERRAATPRYVTPRELRILAAVDALKGAQELAASHDERDLATFDRAVQAVLDAWETDDV